MVTTIHQIWSTTFCQPSFLDFAENGVLFLATVSSHRRMWAANSNVADQGFYYRYILDQRITQSSYNNHKQQVCSKNRISQIMISKIMLSWMCHLILDVISDLRRTGPSSPASSLSNRGWKLSGPADLFGFNASNFFLTVSSVTSMPSSMGADCLATTLGIV